MIIRILAQDTETHAVQFFILANWYAINFKLQNIRKSKGADNMVASKKTTFIRSIWSNDRHSKNSYHMQAMSEKCANEMGGGGTESYI
jgi:hypothetical protein